MREREERKIKLPSFLWYWFEGWLLDEQLDLSTTEHARVFLPLSSPRSACCILQRAAATRMRSTLCPHSRWLATLFTVVVDVVGYCFFFRVCLMSVDAIVCPWIRSLIASVLRECLLTCSFVCCWLRTACCLHLWFTPSLFLNMSSLTAALFLLLALSCLLMMCFD